MSMDVAWVFGALTIPDIIEVEEMDARRRDQATQDNQKHALDALAYQTATLRRHLNAGYPPPSGTYNPMPSEKRKDIFPTRRLNDSDMEDFGRHSFGDL